MLVLTRDRLIIGLTDKGLRDESFFIQLVSAYFHQQADENIYGKTF